MIVVAPRPIDLSPGTRDELSATLRVSLITELDADDDSGDYPPGARDYHAEFTVTWYPQHGLHVAKDADPTLRRLADAAGSDVTDEAVRLPVGHGHFLVVDTFGPEVYDALDARESDLEKLASSLFPGGSDDGSMLAPDLDDVVEFVGGFAILVNSVTTDPAWRGASFGLRATGGRPTGAATRMFLRRAAPDDSRHEGRRRPRGQSRCTLSILGTTRFQPMAR